MPTTPYPLPSREYVTDLARRMLKLHIAKIDPKVVQGLRAMIEGRVDIKRSVPFLRRAALLVLHSEELKPSMPLRLELLEFLHKYGPLTRGEETKEPKKRIDPGFDYSDYLKLKDIAARDGVTVPELVRRIVLVAIERAS